MRFTAFCLSIFLLFAIQLPTYAKPKKLVDKAKFIDENNIARLFPVELSTFNEDDAPPNSFVCGTTTFYMHLKDNGGKKIVLHEVQGIPEGGFVATGELLGASGREGIILILDKAGKIISQQILKVNGLHVSIQAVRINLNGAFTLAGIIEGSNNSFVAQYASNLSLNWIQVFKSSTAPQKVTLHLLTMERHALAIQLASSVNCIALNKDGTYAWQTEVVSAGLINLLGFTVCGNNYNLVTQHFRSGKSESQVTSLSSDGTIISASIIGDVVLENKALDISSNSSRMPLLSISKKSSSSSFTIVRRIFYNAELEATEHTYQVAGNYDFNCSGAMDIAGDVMGICTPADGKLLFIKQFADYQTKMRHSSQYNVPVGGSIFSVTRATDGGYLFGINTKASDEVIFIKTDSIGTLAGCGNQTMEVDAEEANNLTNIKTSVAPVNSSFSAEAASASLSNAVLSTAFDCNENFCPEAPQNDTCQATYYKLLRSNSFSDAFNDYSLMRSNKHLLVTSRMPRMLEDVTLQQTGLKLFDEAGNFIKGISFNEQEQSTLLLAKQFDDSTVLLCFAQKINNLPHFIFRLFSDDLKVIWTRTVKVGPDFTMYSGGSVIGDVHRDMYGNYYLSFSALGFNETPKIAIYKMDSRGNPLWISAFSVGGSSLGSIGLTSTTTSIITVAEGGNGSVSAQFDINDGRLLNIFRYSNTGAGYQYRRTLEFNAGRIFYAGDNQKDFVMALFDTTGRPYKLRTVFTGDVLRAGAVKDGKLYATFFNLPNSVLIITDTALQITDANEYNETNYFRGMKVAANGSIYGVGNVLNEYEFNPFIKKYDANGRMGVCSVPAKLNVADLPLTITTPATSPIQYALFTVAPDPVFDIFPDSNGQHISASLCTSNPLCKSIKLSGPSSVCQLNTDYTFKYVRNAGCNLTPLFTVDTSLVNLITTTDSTIIVRFKKTGTARLLASINAGCNFYSDSILVKIQDGKNFSLGVDREMCKGDTIILDAGSGFSTYTWHDGSAKPQFIATKAGIYFIKVTNNCGEVFYDTVQIIESVIPNLFIGKDTSICKFDTLRINASAGFANYFWQPVNGVNGNGPNVFVQLIASQQISVKAITANGCITYDTISILVKEARPVLLRNDTSFCLNDSVKLDAGNGYAQYSWSTGESVSQVYVSKAGTYAVSVKDLNGCIAKDTFKVIQVYALPAVNLGQNFNLCFGEKQQLDAGNFVSYLWQDNSTSRYFTATGKGVYTVAVVDENNCKAEGSIELKNVFLLPVNFLVGPDSICSYEKIDLKAPPNFSNFNWSTGSTLPTITVESAGNYWLTAKDNNGCVGKDTIQIFPKECISGLFIPNAFTPNKDGLNDVFRVKAYGLDFLFFKLTIYNRFGEQVFSTNNPDKGWDGRLKGIEQSSGIYVWHCAYQLAGRNFKKEKGTLTLVR